MSGGKQESAGPELRPPRGVSRRMIVFLWLGLLAAPAAFLVDLVASFAMVESACERGHRWGLWAVTLAAIAVAVAGGWRAWRNFRDIGLDPEPFGEGVEHRSDAHSTGHALSHELRTDAPEAEGRSRFMALGGLALSAYFLVLIVASMVPALFLAPCG